MERIALPHVESSFNAKAYSRVGAAGLWQFTRSTGRRFLRIDSVVDERLDTYKATVSAARLLRENHRLTFKLASPEDFWFHAQGVPGAHVVVRTERREPRLPARTLEEAASIAAWYSDAREQSWADVQWTRRKYVRRPRGAAPGTVVLKKFETLRVRPVLPRPEE